MTSDDVQEQRERLLDSWEAAAKGWGRQADRTAASALPISQWMIDHAGLAHGQRVLELAAGPGDTGFMAARLIEPDGTLISSDASAAMLDVARERAQEQGIANVEFKQLQLEWIDLEAASVDAILCRWGVMLIVDPSAALRECRRVLKPGGRLALAVWDVREKNLWAAIPDGALVGLGHSQPTAAGAPGMFALSAPGQLRELLDGAGFMDVEVETLAIARRWDSVLDWIGETRDRSRNFGAVWAGMTDEQRRALRERIADDAAAYTDAGGAIEIPGSCLMAVAAA
ncbi:MAG: class I SAM-dependent methyltransferase [Conexibacteraceae bacterium]|nr:class I SAM-dependent methyltransferase [Conexibacteraceae bacterium]